jgi:bifunctional enzyme CysN/CysC
MRQAVANARTRETDAQADAPGRDQVLRLIAGGDAGAGKSTLVARLVREPEGSQARPLPDPPAQDLLIGLSYRYFSASGGRRMAVVDPPGHERFPQAIVTSAPAARLALIVLDAAHGLTAGARADCAVAAVFGIRRIVLALTKLDLVDYAPEAYETVHAAARSVAGLPGIEDVACVPVSGLYGDNVLAQGDRMPWYDGPTLLEQLEAAPPEDPPPGFRLWIQRGIGSAVDGRGFVGTVVGGQSAPGDRVVILPSGRESRVRRIVAHGGELERAAIGHSVELELEDALELEPGDLVSAAVARASVGDQFEATVAWMGDEPLVPGRGYLMRVGTQTAAANVGAAGGIQYLLDPSSLERCAAAPELGHGQIGICELLVSRRIAFDPHSVNPDTGSFLLLDRITLEPVAAGLVHRALRESQDVCWQALAVDKAARAATKHQRPCIVWLTGLPSAGKSTIANALERRLHSAGYHTYVLDGDNIRHGLNRDLGFSTDDRDENIRRIGEVAKLMVDAGLIVICSFISPHARERGAVRGLVEPGEFIEVYVDTPVEVAEQRDPKGFYQRARRGELTGFTGVDAPYEPPEHPEVHLDAGALTPEESARRVIEALLEAGVIDASAAAV